MWTYFFVLLWVMYMLSAGIHIFSRGFLLSRQTLQDVNECEQMEFCEDKNNTKCMYKERVEHTFRMAMNETSSRFCMPKKTKVILVVIDALKYEFGLHDDALENPRPYQNRLPVVQRLRKQFPERTRFMKFVADPPTTTLQRLKGMTTGGLPTFVDVGSNFDTPEINEDNIIDQLIRHNRDVVFMGDSTWTELYPNRFKRQYPFPSFNILDLDTVDINIQKRLPGEMVLDDWDLLIAHFLGVDHCGHKHGPNHSEMSRKLTEMNSMIEELILRMDEDTTLLVIGDHGMTANGDHGGDSPDEVNAMLFAYNKKTPFHIDETVEEISFEMRQIDIVPTLSIILGVPIPFSNLGQINYNLIPNTNTPHFDRSLEFLAYSLQNVWQMRFYQQRIADASVGLFTEEALADHTLEFHHVTVHSLDARDPNARRRYHEEIVRPYLTRIQSQFRDVWVKFDASQMSQGLLFISLFSVLLFLLIENVPVLFYSRIFTTYRIMFVYSMNVVLAGVSWANYKDMGFGSELQAAIVTTSVFNIAMISFAVMADFDLITATLKYRQLSKSILLTRAVFIFSLGIFFSNSFIVQEQHILSYTLMGVVCILLYSIQKTHMRFDSRIKFRLKYIFESVFVKLIALTALALLMIRMSHVMFQCREEQGNCTEFKSAKESNNSAKKSIKRHNDLTDLMPILVFAFFVTFVSQFLKHMNNLHGFRLSVVVAKFGPPTLVVCTGAHFALTRTTGHGIPSFHIDALAWVVYAAFVLQICVLLYSPLLVKVRKIGLDARPKTIVHIYNEIKSIINDNEDEDAGSVKIPWTDGLRGAYSATFVVTGLFFAMLVALLLGPNASSGIVVTYVVAAVVLVLATVLRFQTARSLEKCLQPQFLTLFAWSLMAHYSFFATSHQPTLSQIDWRAAFVGRQNPYFQHNGYISAALVLLNTFGGHILLYLMYPLLCIFGFGLYARYPSLIPKPYVTTHQRFIVNLPLPNNGVNNVLERLHHFELPRGDLNLYEKEEALKSNVFRAGCQLMVLQGFRIFCSMLACTIHCRHLMVWKIFAPKFIFEGISSYLSFGAIIVAYLILIRVHAAVEGLLGRIALNKASFKRFSAHKRVFDENIKQHLEKPHTDATDEDKKRQEAEELTKRLMKGISKQLERKEQTKKSNGQTNDSPPTVDLRLN